MNEMTFEWYESIKYRIHIDSAQLQMSALASHVLIWNIAVLAV